VSETTPTLLAALVQQLANQANGAPGHDTAAVNALRSSGLDNFRTLGLPTPRMEDWKYTNVRAIERRDFRLGDSTNANEAQDYLSLGAGADAACTLVFINGHLSTLHGAVPDGVTLLGLDEALRRDPDAVLAVLGKLAPSESQGAAHGFVALNAAALTDGVFLHIRDEVTVAQPINLVFVSTADGVASLPRTVVHVGAGASAHIVEHFTGSDDAVYLMNRVTEAVLEENATLELSTLQEDGRKAFHINTTAVRLMGGASFTNHALSIGAAIARNDINTWFTAPNANATLNGLYIGSGRQHVDFHTRTYHDAPDCTSKQHYKGILDGHGRGVFNGQVHVAVDAQRSDAEQANHNLLLSRNAEIDTKPQLEIYADDVKCAHGTTVGQLDSDMLFYLRSRGIPDEQARGMLTYGFAHDIAARLSLDALRERVEHVLLEVLPYGESIKELQ
jgi:Fe-S cluster assembly protein SufD